MVSGLQHPICAYYGLLTGKGGQNVAERVQKAFTMELNGQRIHSLLDALHKELTAIRTNSLH
jgi:hypothetical protein